MRKVLFVFTVFFLSMVLTFYIFYGKLLSALSADAEFNFKDITIKEITLEIPEESSIGYSILWGISSSDSEISLQTNGESFSPLESCNLSVDKENTVVTPIGKFKFLGVVKRGRNSFAVFISLDKKGDKSPILVKDGGFLADSVEVSFLEDDTVTLLIPSCSKSVKLSIFNVNVEKFKPERKDQ